MSVLRNNLLLFINFRGYYSHATEGTVFLYECVRIILIKGQPWPIANKQTIFKRLPYLSRVDMNAAQDHRNLGRIKHTKTHVLVLLLLQTIWQVLWGCAASCDS